MDIHFAYALSYIINALAVNIVLINADKLILFIRIISKPAENIICFDLGHKSVAPEMAFPRVRIIGLEDSEQIGQSEEHLIVQTQRANEFEVGDGFYAIPVHICPTVAKYEEVLTVSDGEITGSWKVAARNQKITI